MTQTKPSLTSELTQWLRWGSRPSRKWRGEDTDLSLEARNSRLYAILLIILLGLVACGGNDRQTGAPPQQPTAVPQTGSPATAPPTAVPLTVQPRELTLRVRNDSGTEICDILIGRTAAQGFENDLLGEETLLPGGVIEFTVLPDKYNLVALDCNDNEQDVAMPMMISSNSEWVIDP